jgi:hypothetical protein
MKARAEKTASTFSAADLAERTIQRRAPCLRTVLPMSPN